MATIVYLALEDFETICNELQSFFKRHNDPIPVYSQTYFDKLDSVINTPKKTFDKKELYPTVYAKAACYFYFINKFHPFNNGNKRISIVATGVFLMFNGIDITASEDTIYNFAKKITVSNKIQDHDFHDVVKFLKKHSKKESKKQPAPFSSLLNEVFKIVEKIRTFRLPLGR